MEFSDQLKSQLNIVDVIGQYVRLKREPSGQRFKGLCPFHSEKTPSFNVNAALGFYYCFGCQASGDLFRFVMEHDHLTFPEALRTLADRYGISMPERQRVDDPESRERAVLMEMHELAAEIFVQNLRGSKGGAARQYLERRNVSADSIREFRLGLSDTSGQQLTSRLSRYGERAIEKSGLVARRDDGSFYDRFRGRLMFPIHNESGKAIAFGGRALREGDDPKYLNSPETVIYKKSAVLYNLHRAKIDARKNDRMVLVEGYMDVIGVWAAGVHEVVASSGTALSPEQVRTIKRQISLLQAGKGTIILNFDPDPAGERSTEKYIQAALAEGLRVRVLKIPGGLDPDEYIAAEGEEAYRNLLTHAESYFQWLADRARERYDLRSAEGRVDAFRFMLPALEALQNRVERGAIANELAQYLQVDLDVIRQSLKTNGAGAPKASSATDTLPPNEKLLLLCLLASGDARATVRAYLHGSEMLQFLTIPEIFSAILLEQGPGSSSSFSLQAALERLGERDRRILSELSFLELRVSIEEAPQQALHCLEALEATASTRLRDELKRRVREAEKLGNMDEAFRLIQELENVKSVSVRA